MSGPMTHYTETQKDGWFLIKARPAPMATGPALAALFGAVVAATVLTVVVSDPGRHINIAGAIWFISAIGLGFLFAKWAVAADRRKRNIPTGDFGVQRGAVWLPNGTNLFITGQFTVNRRNTNHPGVMATAHYVALDYEGKSYVLAGGLTDAQSMAVSHEVYRRLNGEP